MNYRFPVYIGDDAPAALLDYCRACKTGALLIISDRNTHAALGARLAQVLAAGGLPVEAVVLQSREVVADAAHILEVLLAIDGGGRSLLAVGSGTITDIVRFVAHRTHQPLISVPTAPSVDGYASVGAPLVVGTYKQTITATAPAAIFADLETLCAAPPLMIAAGFADMICKYSSLADWHLGHLLWGERYDEAIAQDTLLAVRRVRDAAPAIARHDKDGIRCLMQGLVDSGLGILAFGASHPASGAEHHLSHFWEMKLLRERRPAILHGIKVGLGAVLTAGYWEEIRHIDLPEAEGLLRRSTRSDQEREVTAIRAVFGEAADQVIADQTPFLQLSAESYDDLRARIVAGWAEIQAIAATVPPPGEVVTLLRSVGSLCRGSEVGFSAEEVALAETHAHYLRNRFTVMKLRRVLGLSGGS